jgi:hypothetical protein
VIRTILLLTRVHGTEPAWAAASADRALLARVLSESRVQRSPARPATAEYLQAWSEAVRLWLERFFGRHPGMWEGMTWGLQIAAWFLVGVAIVLLVLALVRLLRRRSRAAQAPTPAAAVATGASPGRPDRAGWRGEVERRLDAGDIDGALEALWWWFASSLVREVDPSWTSQELLRAARRSDLAFAAAALDRALYGARRPEADDVSGLLVRLESALA